MTTAYSGSRSEIILSSSANIKYFYLVIEKKQKLENNFWKLFFFALQ